MWKAKLDEENAFGEDELGTEADSNFERSRLKTDSLKDISKQ